VDVVREHQREWLERTRQRVLDGEPFAVCNADEFEELFHVLDIPVLVINYWNFMIIAQRKARHFTEVLNQRGYAGPHFFGLGLAATLEPEEAPRGGLPRPSIVLGTTRSEGELRVTELWARALGCPCIPLEFNIVSGAKTLPPDDWWKDVRSGWPALVDPPRLDLRLQQVRALVSYLETTTGRSLSLARLQAAMTLVDEQVELYDEVRDLLASASLCPVTLRDQIAMYQPMWHRGTPAATDLLAGYRDEVRERVEAEVGAYRDERIRVYYWSMHEDPAFHPYMQEQFGAVFVACPYYAVASAYAREVYDGDPLRALVARQLMLFALTTGWHLNEARRHRCDAVVAIEPRASHPSDAQLACEAAGMPFLSLPHPGDGEHTRDALRRFFEPLKRSGK
jgi:hypothetical protein